jgi:hypothetical protein
MVNVLGLRACRGQSRLSSDLLKIGSTFLRKLASVGAKRSSLGGDNKDSYEKDLSRKKFSNKIKYVHVLRLRVKHGSICINKKAKEKFTFSYRRHFAASELRLWTRRRNSSAEVFN